jgi:hypothetical protein
VGSEEAAGAVVGAVMLIELLPVIFRFVPGSKIMVAVIPDGVDKLEPPVSVSPLKK